jgi:hypothetical protein
MSRDIFGAEDGGVIDVQNDKTSRVHCHRNRSSALRGRQIQVATKM